MMIASTLLATLLVFVSSCRAQYYWDDENKHQIMSSGYFFRNGDNIYKIVLEKYDKRTWTEAEQICEKEENGHLLTFGNKKESQWVMKLMSNLTEELGYLGRFWIGATDKRLRGVYEYIDGSPFKYDDAPWAPGEPNRPVKKLVKYQYCIVMDTKDKDSKWSDEDCFESFGYICKSNEAPRRLRALQRFGYSWEWNFYDYKFVILPDDSMTWSEAEIYCQEAESGHLLSIYNSQEGEWVTDRIRQIRQVLGFQELWIGATDIFSRGSFTWTDQKPVNYTKWNITLPGNETIKSRKPREACVTILAHPNWGSWSEEYCIKKLPFVCKTKKCQGKSDLAFIVDASGSVTEAGFRKAKNFVFQVIRGFQVKRNETHIGLIGFSDEASLIFGFKSYFGNLQLKKAIDNMDYTKGETETHKALTMARTTIFSKKGGSRDDVPKIALVLTDGKSRVSFKTSQAAKKLKEEGVTIVSLGIGDGVDRKELVTMASGSRDVLYVESYAALGAKVKDIRQRVCDEIIRVGLLREKLKADSSQRQIDIDKKRRLEVERERKLADAKKRQQEQAKKRQQEQAKKRQQEQAKKRQQEQAKKRQQEQAKKRQQEQAKKRQQEQAKKRQQEQAKKRQTQNRNTQNRNRNTQNRNTQNRNIQNRNRNTQNRNIQNRNRNTQNRNTQNRNRNTQNRNTQNRNTQNRNTQNRNIQNRNTQNRNTQNRNTQNRNTQNRNIQNRYRNTQNRNTQNRNTQNRNRNTQNRNTQNRYNQNRNTQNRNTQNRYTQNRNRNTQNRNTQNRYNQNRNTQNRYNQNRNTQNRNRYNQNRNTQNRNRYNQNRNTQNRNRYNQNRNTQNRYNQRNQRNQRNRYQG